VIVNVSIFNNASSVTLDVGEVGVGVLGMGEGVVDAIITPTI
jgi:hypothetical protein